MKIPKSLQNIPVNIKKKIEAQKMPDFVHRFKAKIQEIIQRWKTSLQDFMDNFTGKTARIREEYSNNWKKTEDETLKKKATRDKALAALDQERQARKETPEQREAEYGVQNKETETRAATDPKELSLPDEEGDIHEHDENPFIERPLNPKKEPKK